MCQVWNCRAPSQAGGGRGEDHSTHTVGGDGLLDSMKEQIKKSPFAVGRAQTSDVSAAQAAREKSGEEVLGTAGRQ